MNQIEIELMPRFRALIKCEDANQCLVAKEIDTENCNTQTGKNSMVTSNQKQIRSKQILAELLKGKLACLMDQTKEHRHRLNKTESNISNETGMIPAEDDDSQLRRSYNEAKRELTVWESELTTLRQTSSLLAEKINHDSKGLASTSSSIESIEELEYRVNEASKLLKQRKGSLAPKVATLKTKRQEVQTLEANSEVNANRTRSKEAKERELETTRNDASQLRTSIKDLEHHIELLKALSSDFNPDKQAACYDKLPLTLVSRIKRSVVELKTEIRKLEAQKPSADEVRAEDKLHSWKQVSQLLENLIALHSEEEKDNINDSQFHIDSNSNVLMIE
eukprot:g1145.t1